MYIIIASHFDGATWQSRLWRGSWSWPYRGLSRQYQPVSAMTYSMSVDGCSRTFVGSHGNAMGMSNYALRWSTRTLPSGFRACVHTIIATFASSDSRSRRRSLNFNRFCTLLINFVEVKGNFNGSLHYFYGGFHYYFHCFHGITNPEVVDHYTKAFMESSTEASVEASTTRYFHESFNLLPWK